MFSKSVVHVFVCIVAFYTMNCLVVLLLQLCYNHMFCIWEYLFLSPALSNANTNQLRTYSFMEDIDLFSILFLPLLRHAPANPYYLPHHQSVSLSLLYTKPFSSGDIHRDATLIVVNGPKSPWP